MTMCYPDFTYGALEKIGTTYTFDLKRRTVDTISAIFRY